MTQKTPAELESVAMKIMKELAADNQEGGMFEDMTLRTENFYASVLCRAQDAFLSIDVSNSQICDQAFITVSVRDSANDSCGEPLPWLFNVSTDPATIRDICDKTAKYVHYMNHVGDKNE